MLDMEKDYINSFLFEIDGVEYHKGDNVTIQNFDYEIVNGKLLAKENGTGTIKIIDSNGKNHYGFFGSIMKQKDFKSEYMLLDRLRIDCEYYVQNQNMGANAKCLWALDEKKQIEKMRELYDLLPVKPEWLTREQIDEYEKKMIKL